MRQMKNKVPYVSETIRPSAVLRAAEYLCQTELYKKHNITLNSTWVGTYDKNNLNRRGGLIESENMTIELEDDGDEWDETVNDLPLNPGCQESLLTRDLIDNNESVRFAPAENNRPISLLNDEDFEELSFPTIYCGSIRKFKSKVSLNDIGKSEAPLFDRRCAMKIPKLMVSFCRQRVEKLNNKVNIYLRRKIKSNLTALAYKPLIRSL